jgi:multidrug efflux pump subunit AcrA (membrane-fusion protein)
MRTALKLDGALAAPGVGVWWPAVGVGAPLTPDLLLGRLERAGATLPIRAPAAVHGVAARVAPAGAFVVYGDVLITEGEGLLSLAAGPAASRTSDLPPGVEALLADTDGTVWLRPKPGAPAFVDEGAAVNARQTLALVEVMKTFSPVRAPANGVIVRVCVADGAAVGVGAPLLWIRREG